MKLNDYQKDAMSFRKPSAHGYYALFNISGEVGELHSLIAKGFRDGQKPDHQEQIKKELGDIFWMLAALADDFGHTLEEIAQGNLDKLSGRTARGTISGSGDDR